MASRICISNLHKNTCGFRESVEILYKNVSVTKKRLNPLLSEECYSCMLRNMDVFEKAIDPKRDYNIDYFGFKTLEKSYLKKSKDQIVETPQFLFMRVSVGIYGDDIDKVVKMYNDLSRGYYIHATPTLFNSGTEIPQMSSCFITPIKDDSIDGIYGTLKRCAKISRSSGG